MMKKKITHMLVGASLVAVIALLAWAVNEQELAGSVAATAGLSKSDAVGAVNAVFDAITHNMLGGDKVFIEGFGTFEIQHHVARKGGNPATGRTTQIPAQNIPIFKAARELKRLSN